MDNDKNSPAADEDMNRSNNDEDTNKIKDIDDLGNDISEEDIIVVTPVNEDTKNQQAITDEDNTGKFDSTCRCFQKLNGKYYCYELQQGNWVQVSIVPFDTQEECEEANCQLKSFQV